MKLVSRMVWLVTILKEREALTFNEIDSLWQRNGSLNCEGVPLPKRTFHDWIDRIYDMFNLEIKCDNGGEYRYRIVNVEDLESNALNGWLLNSVAFSDCLVRCKNLRERIVFEESPSPQSYFLKIIDAMHDSHPIYITYHNFVRDDYREHTLYPYFLKQYQRRWYVVAFSVEDKAIRKYCVSRITKLDVLSNESFIYDPKSCTNDSHCSNTTGIFGSENEAVDITFRASGEWVWYLRETPIHHSQTEIENTEEGVVFRIHAAITVDMDRQFMSIAHYVPVISPVSYRKHIRSCIAEAERLIKEAGKKKDNR